MIIWKQPYNLYIDNIYLILQSRDFHFFTLTITQFTLVFNLPEATVIMSQLWKEIVNNSSTERKDHMNEQRVTRFHFS